MRRHPAATEAGSVMSQRYQIRVLGHLDETKRSAFDELDVTTEDDDTVISAMSADKPALHGLPAQIEALGLDLLEVRRIA
jgi:hypothetical protein